MVRKSSTQPPEPWRGFLEALDSSIDEPVDLHCLGGFVVSLMYGVSRETSDLDVLAARAATQLANLERLAGRGSALHRRYRVYLQPVTVATYPEEYEKRLVHMWPRAGLKRLRLYALEPNDLALTKLERNSDVDRQDVLSLARARLVNARTLRERYEKEFRPNVVSAVEKLDLTMQLWLEMIAEKHQ